MIYIDIDGVLADTDAFIFSKDPRAEHDTHLLFKTIYKNYKEMFVSSKPLIDLSVLKTLGDFTLLTALPLRQKIDSFCKDKEEINEVMNTLAENKKQWIKNNLGDCKYIIVGKRSEKLDMCNSLNDILIDDSKATCAAWKKRGGKTFASVDEFLKANVKMNGEELTAVKENLW